MMKATDASEGKVPTEINGVPIINVNNNPLQSPGKHHKVREWTLGGPETKQDRRLYLARSEIEKWLNVSKNSVTGRVQLDMIGIKFITWFDKRSQHMYQTIEFVHLPPKAEHPSAVAGLAQP